MKRALSLFLALVLCVSLFPVAAFAADETAPSITATTTATNPAIGQSIEVTFELGNNPGFTNIEMTLDFNKDVLQFTGLKVNEDTEAFEGRFGGGATVVNTTAGHAQYGFLTNARDASSTNDGKLFVALFDVIGPGSTEVGATVSVFQNAGEDGTPVDYAPTVTATSAISVAGIPATAVTLSASTLSLEEGSNQLLSATVEPDDSTDEVVWASDNEAVATVVNGQVRAVATGTATITAKANDTAYATCAVTVTAEQSVVGKSAKSYGDWDDTAALTGIRSVTVGGAAKTVKNIYKLSLTGHEEFYLRAVGGTMSVGYKLDGSSCIGDPWGTDMSAQGVNYSWADIHTKDLLVSYADLVTAVGTDNASKLGVSEDDTLAFLYVKNPDAYNYGILFKIDAPPEATSISIPEILEVTVGNDSTLTASLEPNGAEADITWTSADTSIATVDENGKVTGVANGTTTITATITTSAGTLSDTCTVTVATAIANIPSNGDYSGSLNSITIGGVAIEDYSWSGKTLNVYVPASTNTTAKVRFDWTHSYNRSDSQTVDVAITDGVGTYSGFTTYGDWVINFAVRVPATGISLNKETTQIRIGDKETLTATITPDNSTDSITWTSTDSAIAKVDKNGMVTAVAAGEVDITATAGEKSAICKVTVYAVPATAVTISGEGIENGKLRLLKGQYLVPTVTIDPENTTDKVSYAIADSTIASINAYSGQIKALKEGTTTYTVTVGNVSATLEVEVYEIHATSLTLDNSTLSMNYGDSVTLTATVLPEDHTDGSVTWESSDTSVVTVDNGTVKAVGGGTATVTATLGSLCAECAVTVAEPYKVTDNLPTLADPYGYSVKMDYVNISGAEVESVSWDGLTCNVTLKEGTADGTSVKATAHVSAGYMGSKDFSGSGTLADGACAVTVTCSEWWMTATDLVFNFTVASNEDTPSGDDSSSVTATLSLSADDKFMVGRETGEIMAFKNITVPYFDLANYGLEEYYFVSESYGDDGDGLPGSDLEPGTPEYAEGKVTLLHLYLYALERFYCGVSQEEVGQGYLYDEGLIGTDVFSISGGVGSSFLNQFWGGDCNLNYYVNYEYPLASAGWGSTSDQILLRDGDMITLGHFSGWSFYGDTYSIFNYITADNKAPAQGEEVTLTLMYAGPNMGTSTDTAQNLNTYCVDVYCTPVDSLTSEDVTNWDYLGTSDENGELVVDTSEMAPGKYIVAVPGQYGVDFADEICSTPGGMILTVGQGCEHEFANGSCIHCGKPDPAFVPITGLALSSASTEEGKLALVAGGSEKLNVTITPANANQGYSWSSDNEDVATVNNGIVTAVSTGTATITVTAGDATTFAAKSTPVTASVTVTVTEPAAGYTVKMPGDATVNAGQTIDIPVTLGSTDNAAYNAFDITVTYPAALTLTTTELEGLDVTAGEGSVRIKGYGEARDAGTAPFTLRFEAAEVGEHSVTVTAAKVDNSKGAIAADAPDAALIDDVTVVTVIGYSVTLPEGFTGKSAATPGEAYTFTEPEDHYDHHVTITIGGEEVSVEPVDGSYTIPADKVKGAIVVTDAPTAKVFDVALGEYMDGDTTAQYGTAYSAKLNRQAAYKYTVKITVDGKNFTGYTVANDVYTIPGTAITGDIAFIVTKELSGESGTTMHRVYFTGEAGVAPAETTVVDGSDYSFQLSNTEAGYAYTVTVGGEPLTADETGKYTVKNIKADTEIVITKALAAETTVEVKDYVTKDGGKQVKLVLVKGELAEGKVFAYGGEAMFYSEAYEAWAYLDIAAGTEAFTTDTARAKVSTVAGTLAAQTVAQTFDVNGSGAVDINDAQLAYDIYKPEMYTDFNTVSVLKFLNADVNGSYSVTTEDAAAVVAEIL